MTMPKPLTEQQSSIISSIQAGNDVMVIARAGVGKTYTIVEAAKRLPFGTEGIALAFNKKIAGDLAKRLPSTISAITMNGLGHRAWGSAIGRRLQLDTDKIWTAMEKVLKEKALTLNKKERPVVKAFVDTLRNYGAVPDGTLIPGKALVDWATAVESAWTFLEEPEFQTEINTEIGRLVLLESIKMGYAGIIDFTDQLYLPVVFGGNWPNPQILFVDEAQDLSPVNHIMVRNCRAKQLVVVGDPMQAIYAFRGALTDSMDQFSLSREFDVQYLTKTFRCGKAIVSRAQKLVPDFVADDSNVEGMVVDNRGKSWTFDILQPDTAILCRNNAPLIRMALRLLRARIPATILGRDIARGLIKDIQKANQVNVNITQTLQNVKDYYDAKIAAKESLRNILGDRLAAIRAAGDGATDRDSLIQLIEALFSDEGRSQLVTLATGHKAKGHEWDHVIHLDSFLIPSKMAKTDEEIQQEFNLQYVIETRPRLSLTLVESKNLDAESDDHQEDAAI